MMPDESTPDPTESVMRLLLKADQPLSTAEIVRQLRRAHGEDAVVVALEHWRNEGEVMQGSDGTWSWRMGRFQ
jgi:hypothetical protein